MSIIPPPFPWESVSLPSPAKEFSSPGEIITQVINYQFQIHATKTIFEFITQDVFLPEAIIIHNCDTVFAKTVQTIGRLSKHCLDSTVISLHSWRQSMNPTVEDNDSKRQSSSSKHKHTKSAGDIAQSEKQAVIVDYIYTEVMNIMISHYDGENITSKTMDVIEGTIFNAFMATPAWKNDSLIKNRDYVRNSFRILIKEIGKFRIGNILAKFFTFYTLHMKSPSLLIALMDGLVEVEVNHTLDDQVKAACGIISTVDSNLKPWVLKVKKVEQKLGYCAFLGSILSTMSQVPTESIASELKSMASGLVESIEATIKKSKTKHLYLLPLAASTLCVCDHSVFYNKFDFLVENLLLPHKDAMFRTACLESVYNLIYASMTKFDDKNEARKQKIRGYIAHNLCPSNNLKKTLLSYEEEQIDIVLDIIELLSLLDVESVIASIIMLFLNYQPMTPEYLMIGIYSLLRIYKRLGGVVVSNLYPQILIQYVNHPKTRQRKQTLNDIILQKKSSAENRHIGEAHLTFFSQYLSQNLAILHQSLGNFTKVGDQKHYDSTFKDKASMFYALEASIAGIQIVIPSGIYSVELFTYITKYTLHNYPGISITSLQVLKQIITSRGASYAFLISHCLYKIIFSIPDQYQDTLNDYANNILQLFRTWYYAANSEENQLAPTEELSINEPNFEDLDGLGLFFLCNSNCNIQEYGYEILKTIQALSGHYPKFPLKSLYSVINNYSSECIASSYVNNSLFSKTMSVPNQLPTFEEIIKKDNRHSKFHYQYSKILAKTVNHLVKDGLVDTFKSFFKIVKDRIIPCQSSIETDDKVLLLWRNYVSCFSAGSELIDSQNNDMNPSQIDTSTIDNARDLIKLLLPNIRSSHKGKKFAAESAITYMTQSVKSSLISELSIYERYAFYDEKVKPKVKTQSMIILSYVYRIILENMCLGYLLDNEYANFKQISPIFKQLIDRTSSDDQNTSDNTIDIQFYRYNICQSLKLIFSEINTIKQLHCKDIYEREFFDSCFGFLTKCSGFGDTMAATTDAQKSKDRKAFLVYIKDHPADEKERLKSIFEEQAVYLQNCACESLVQLCYAPCDDDEQRKKMIWIANVFASGSLFQQECARKALVNLLRTNKDQRGALFASLIDSCYSGDPNKGMNNFRVIAEIYNTGKLPLYNAVLLTLGLHKLCDQSYDVRQIAVKFLKNVCSRKFPGKYNFVEAATIYDTYQSNQQLLAIQIATNHPSVSVSLIEESFIRFRHVDDTARERLLKIVHPFLKNVELSKLPQSQSCGLLETLCTITYKYSEQFTNTMEKLWSNLATSPNNINFILNYLISFASIRRNNNILIVGEKITLLLSRVLPSDVINKLIYELFSIRQVGKLLSPDEYQQCVERDMEEQSTIKPSWAKDAVFLFPSMGKNKPFSRSNIAVIFLQGIILEKFDTVKDHIPLIISVMILFMDAKNDRVTDAFISIINNLYFHVTSIRSARVIEGGNNNDDDEYQSLLNIIHSGWKKSEFMAGKSVRDNKMFRFITMMTNFLQPLIPDLTNQLMICALRWACTSESSHLLCRALQLYRYLHLPVSSQGLYYLLTILENHLSNRKITKSSRYVMMEIILALQSSAELSSSQLILSNYQIWSTALICLQTDNEKEYGLAIDLLATLLSNLNFNDPLVVDKLANPFKDSKNIIASGIQPFVLKGLTSEHTEEVSRTLLSEFVTIQCDKLIDPLPTRTLDNIVALLPYILSNIVTEDNEVLENVFRITSNMVTLFNSLNCNDIAAVFTKFTQGEYADANEFLLEFNNPFYNKFVKGNEVRVFSLLFYNVLFGSKKYKSSTLLVFEAFQSQVDITTSPLQKQMMGMYYYLLELISSDKWEDLIPLFEVAVENSLPVEKLQFSHFPNPSTLMKIIETISPLQSPWTNIDVNKPVMLDLLKQTIKTLKNPKLIQDFSSFGNLVVESIPVIQTNALYSYRESTSFDVIHQNKKLKFIEDGEGKKESNSNLNSTPSLSNTQNFQKPLFIPAPSFLSKRASEMRVSRFSVGAANINLGSRPNSNNSMNNNSNNNINNNNNNNNS